MKGYLSIVMMLGAVLLAVPSTSHGEGAIDGTVVYSDGLPHAYVTVQLFDAGNAEIIGETTTGAAGSFGFRPVRAGSYKVRFSMNKDPEKSAAEFYDEDGQMHVDEFLLGTEIAVVDDLVVYLNKSVLKPQISSVQYYPVFAFYGYVFDALTGTPLPDLEVRLIDGANALPLHAAVTTTDGYFQMETLEKHHSISGKIRIVDPSGTYKPEFVGAGDADVFEKGTAYDLSNGDKFALKESLDMLTPAESIATIVEDVVWLGLDSSVESALTGTLTRATGFLTDENPNNNRAACGALTGFVHQMNGHVKNGRITQEEADALAASAGETLLSLQCP